MIIINLTIKIPFMCSYCYTHSYILQTIKIFYFKTKNKQKYISVQKKKIIFSSYKVLLNYFPVLNLYP